PPPLLLGTSATLRLPKGITWSGRGEYQGGAWIHDGASTQALLRSVRWPTCARAYPFLTAGDTNSLTARERLECLPLAFAKAGDASIMWFPQDFFKLRDVTLTIPVGWAIRRATSATLAITVQNYFKWINRQLRLFDPEMVGRDALDSQNRDISEHFPPPALAAALGSASGTGGQSLYWGAAVSYEINPAGSTGSFGIPPDVQGGLLLESTTNADWTSSNQARFVAEEAVRRFKRVMPDTLFAKSPLVIRAYLYAGYANRLLGENCCQSVIPVKVADASLSPGLLGASTPHLQR